MKKASKIVMATLAVTTAFATPATAESLETRQEENKVQQFTHTNMHCENDGNGDFSLHAKSFNGSIEDFQGGEFNPFSNQVLAKVDPQTVHPSVKEAFDAVNSLAIMDLGKETCTIAAQVQVNERMKDMRIHVPLKGQQPSNQ